jgi:hypothetical protein
MSMLDYGVYSVIVCLSTLAVVLVMMAIENIYHRVFHRSDKTELEETAKKNALVKYHSGQELTREESVLLGLYEVMPDDE